MKKKNLIIKGLALAGGLYMLGSTFQMTPIDWKSVGLLSLFLAAIAFSFLVDYGRYREKRTEEDEARSALTDALEEGYDDDEYEEVEDD